LRGTGAWRLTIVRISWLAEGSQADKLALPIFTVVGPIQKSGLMSIIAVLLGFCNWTDQFIVRIPHPGISSP
jgi:hypothetical protein